MPALSKYISPEDWEMMVQGFRENLSIWQISDKVKAATGNSFSKGVIQRRRDEWDFDRRNAELGRRNLENVLELWKAEGKDPAEFLKAIAVEHMEKNPHLFEGADPVKVGRLALSAQGVSLKKREVEIRERQVAVQEGKLSLLEQRAKAVLDTDTNADLTPEERLRRIREIYGLSTANDPLAGLSAQAKEGGI
jgi:hypothetical protein